MTRRRYGSYRERSVAWSDDTKVSSDRWLVSYADFITLLFGFFLVMYSVSQVSDEKYDSLSVSLSNSFLDAKKKWLSVDSQPTEKTHHLNTSTAIESLAHQIDGALRSGFGSDLNRVDYTDTSLTVSLDAQTLFTSGSDQLGEDATQALKVVYDMLSRLRGEINIEGHTDNVPMHSTLFKNNWVLSSARALAVVDHFVSQGIQPVRLAAIGYGEHRPVADNDSEQGRAQNRRVVIQVETDGFTLVEESLPAVIGGSDFALKRNKNSSDANNIKGREALDRKGRVDVPERSSDSLMREQTPQTKVSDGNVQQDTVKPVELKNGGLLFTSDPKLPRQTYR